MPSGWVDEQKWHYQKNTPQKENLKWMKSQFTADLILAFLAKPLAQRRTSSSTVFLSLFTTNALSLLFSRAHSRNPGVFLLKRWSEKGTNKPWLSEGTGLGFTIGHTKCITDRFFLLLIGSFLSAPYRSSIHWTLHYPTSCWSEPASPCLSLCGFLVCSCLSLFLSRSCLLRDAGPSFCKITI